MTEKEYREKYFALNEKYNIAGSIEIMCMVTLEFLVVVTAYMPNMATAMASVVTLYFLVKNGKKLTELIEQLEKLDVDYNNSED